MRQRLTVLSPVVTKVGVLPMAARIPRLRELADRKLGNHHIA